MNEWINEVVCPDGYFFTVTKIAYPNFIPLIFVAWKLVLIQNRTMIGSSLWTVLCYFLATSN